ncbi:MAG: 50S ribosomal protein L29 [Candidatus Enteromonas sp.]|nr:50S ribosomal protein L29 [Candidatus Enteromonas sp.]MDY6094305.1 50S ribosomal protein L29 [Candidatus Enteromonas sp.]
MEIKDIRALTPQELDAKIYELKAQLFELRRKKAVGNLENGNVIRGVRKDLAKAETVKRERALGINK